MAVSWVAGSTFTHTTATSITAAAPAGIADNDTLLSAVFARSAYTTPSGWTKIIESAVFTDGGTNQRLAVFSKNTVTSADASANFTFDQASSGRIGIVYAVARGADGVAASASNTVDSTASYQITPTTLTADDDGQMLIAFGSCVVALATTQTPTVPTSFTKFSGAAATQYRLCGAYRLVNVGQSNSGAFDLAPEDPEPEFPIGLGAIILRLEAPAEAVISGLIAAGSPLGAPALLGYRVIAGLVSAASPLGAPALVTRHDFTAQVAGLTTRYEMALTTPGGTVRVPISSWQATLQTEAQNYLQAVVPACVPYLDDINAATAFSILRRVILPDGFIFEYQMAASPVSFVAIAQGTQNYTATISGYSTAFAANADPGAIFDRTLTGVRAVFTQASGIRVRCDLDWLLQPAQRAFYGEAPFIVSYLNYYVSDGDQYMDAGERIDTA